jgi:hypothetical protein
MSSIDQARREVHKAFEAALRVANDPSPRPLGAFEATLWTQVLALGRALIALFLARQAARPRAVAYQHDGIEYELGGSVTSEVGTRFGKVMFERPVGRRVGMRRAARDLPVDRDLGLGAGFSLSVITTVTKLCAQMAFAAARRTFQDMFEWAPSPRATLRMVDAVGAEARTFLEQAPPPEDDGDVLVITVDGKGAPAISSKEYRRRARPRRQGESENKRHRRRARRQEQPRQRRKPGKKSKNAKMAAIGVLYTLRRMPDGTLDGPINKRVLATFESYRALFTWLLAEAKKRGYGTDKFTHVVFIADGAKVIWDLQKEMFPDADTCVDWYHVVEKLWRAGKALYRGRTNQPSDWVAKQKQRLRRGEIGAVMAELELLLASTSRTGPGNKYRRRVLEKTIAYFNEHTPRMQYRRLRKLDIDIGSGIVEGAVRHLVGVRLDGPGMRWGRDRAESVLQLRCIVINNQWDAFTRHLAAKGQVRLAAQPVPTRTHDAKPRKAA